MNIYKLVLIPLESRFNNDFIFIYAFRYWFTKICIPGTARKFVRKGLRNILSLIHFDNVKHIVGRTGFGFKNGRIKSPLIFQQ